MAGIKAAVTYIITLQTAPADSEVQVLAALTCKLELKSKKRNRNKAFLQFVKQDQDSGSKQIGQ